MVYREMPSKNYLVERDGRFSYFRRVPKFIKAFDKRRFIKVALNTDSRDVALTKARMMNAEIESYWKKLIEEKETHSATRFHQTIQFAKHLGFTYIPHNDLIQNKPIEELTERLSKIEKAAFDEKHVEALWGGVPVPEMHLSEVLDVFWGYTKNRIIKKDEREVRKWKNPRKKAMKNFIHVVGDKKVHHLVRDDAIVFRDWWIGRIEREDYVGATANKDFGHVEDILETVCENRKIDLDIPRMFKKIKLDKKDSRKRPPFATDHIVKTLLVAECLNELDVQERDFLFAMAETGARDKELLLLEEEHIVLDHVVPHISIVDSKTAYSTRKIPLVGYALDAFNANPKGFTRYFNKTDELSTSLNKFLRANKLFPTEMHSVYSLRHSFQDRILRVDAPDRVQAELMGHKFNRPAYGDGPTLEHKLEWLTKIQLKKI
ncbi:hypothetical protein Q4E93_09930 [Flavitalea sp. BT771]|uniref:DUF6538 domain-containing protein n=1 Tax=Flavitalea sp. BT771 TaxID=3063329 RepID=UPI0026E1FF87|nr:DUF6538 domain-containing protein [Flavitalea sp. BT771]MDO6430906.1 hypothetical protein [Flavitalea sp. BT771]MDV6218954.1 DUF6538 domain-containing protein [Flavitalea sp. BT771]